MPKILSLSNAEIDDALRDTTRQYLVGDLQKPQHLRHVPSSLIEIGITQYGQEGGIEPAHTHRKAFEFQYVTSGVTAYLDTVTHEQFIFRKGDFYVIEPGVVYAQKSGPHTGILFIKVPPGNDKVPVVSTPEIEAWYKEPIEG
ncbi:MAG TPA: cupin domain-containing protein [Bryobacteraceae bacterium]|jgi:mannose-6-phosphate isomerase-like protein (cupin superfamily)|nr:cupin domain-containing protein [Bryobacteraceae bacterium]